MLQTLARIFFRYATALLMFLFLGAASGCSIFYNSMDQAQEYARHRQYDQAVCKLTGIIESAAPEIEKAQAFMLRGEAYTSLKEYRYAYRDLQVAWKLSCHIYQTSPAQLPAAQQSATPYSGTNSTTAHSEDRHAKQFSPAMACIDRIPLLIDKLKPLTSEFGAIMSTQEASAIVKKMFPELPR